MAGWFVARGVLGRHEGRAVAGLAALMHCLQLNVQSASWILDPDTLHPPLLRSPSMQAPAASHLTSAASTGGLHEPPPSPTASSSPAGGGLGDVALLAGGPQVKAAGEGAATSAGAARELPFSRLQTGSTVGEAAPEIEVRLWVQEACSWGSRKRKEQLSVWIFNGHVHFWLWSSHSGSQFWPVVAVQPTCRQAPCVAGAAQDCSRLVHGSQRSGTAEVGAEMLIWSSGSCSCGRRSAAGTGTNQGMRVRLRRLVCCTVGAAVTALTELGSGWDQPR